MNISHLIITIIGTSCLALVAVWVNLRILHNRVLINSKLHASVSASNQAVVHSTSENELIKRICDAGKMETGYLRMSVIDRFGNVFFDTDSSSNVIDSAFSYDLQDVFDQANKKEPFILKRSLMDVLKNRNNVAVAMVPIYDSGKVRFMLCALANRNFYVEAMHLDLLKEFVGDIEFGFKTFSLEKHKKDTIRRTNVMNRLFEGSQKGLAITDARGLILEANKAYCSLVGAAHGNVINTSIDDLIPNNTLAKIKSNTSKNTEWTGQKFFRSKNGSACNYEVSISEINHGENDPQYLVTLTDLSQHSAMEKELNNLLEHEPVTGLTNKFNFLSKVKGLISAKEKTSRLAFFFVSINEYTLFSDALWDKDKDDIIKLIAEKIASSVGNEKVACRVASSDFLVATNVLDNEQALVIANKIAQAVSITCKIEDVEVALTATIGVGIYEENGKSIHDAVNAAKHITREAQLSKVDKIKFATTNQESPSKKSFIQLDSELKSSVKNNQLELYYQPQVALSTKKIVGYEALIRWNNPRLGLVMPDKFIGLAEQSGFIVEMGYWVIEQACKQIQKWKADEKNEVKIAVNISPSQLFDKNIVEFIKKSLTDHNISKGELELEITESAIMQDQSHAIKILNEIRGLGVNLSIDDFGTGHSSLSYLKKLPVNKVKIDRSFVADLPGDMHSVAIVKAIMSISESINISVLAEGIETFEQEMFLRMHRCLHGQGMLYGMAVKAEDARKTLTSSPP